jgi:hypothetical protein
MNSADPHADCLCTAREALARSARLLDELRDAMRSSRMQVAASRYRVIESRKALACAPRADPEPAAPPFDPSDP